MLRIIIIVRASFHRMQSGAFVCLLLLAGIALAAPSKPGQRVSLSGNQELPEVRRFIS